MPSINAHSKRYAVPLLVFLIVGVTVLIIPPIVLNEATARTYTITAAVVILAVSAVMPYAILVALGTLPLYYTDIASFTAPETKEDGSYSFSIAAALRHVAAGVAYILGAAVVGTIGVGAQIGIGGGSTPIVPVLQPSFLYLGGLVIGGAFFYLQLWRYDKPMNELTRRTIVGTLILGVLLSLSPVVSYWTINGAI